MTTLPLWRRERIVVPCISSLTAPPPQCGMRNAEYQLWTLDFGLWTVGAIAECGLDQPGTCGMRNAECGMEKQGMSFFSPHSSLVTHHLLSTGVRFVIHLHQVVEVDVRVFLGGRETRVP